MLQFAMMTITTHVVASSTNMTILPERRLRNRARVHAITRKKTVLDGFVVVIAIIIPFFID
jgi:hypothetical protein